MPILTCPQNIPFLAFFRFSVDHDRWVGVYFEIRYVFTRDRMSDPTFLRLICKQSDIDGLEFRDFNHFLEHAHHVQT